MQFLPPASKPLKNQGKPSRNHPCSFSEAQSRSLKSPHDASSLPEPLTLARRVNLLFPEGTQIDGGTS